MLNFTRMSCAVLAVFVFSLASDASAQAPAPDPASPTASFTRDWRDHPIWRDGQAEIALYDATRNIDGKERRYTARIMTNKEFADPVTKTRSDTDDPSKDREVFKHHVRDDIPAQASTLHYSTMVYVGVSDLKSLKIDMGSQDDSGASFKQFVNHKGTFEWHEFSYLPGMGHKTTTGPAPAGLVFEDALTFVLRGYPFEQPRVIAVRLLPDQTAAKWTPAEPEDYVIEYVGRETLDLPIGKVDSHAIKVSPASRESKSPTMRYWFAADAAPPLLHILTRYEGPDGATCKLQSQRREAYWTRGR